MIRLFFLIALVLYHQNVHGQSFLEAKAQYLSLRNADSKIKKVEEREVLANIFLSIAENAQYANIEREASFLNAAVLFAECAKSTGRYVQEKKSRDSLQALEVEFPQSDFIDDGYIAVANILGGDGKSSIFSYVLSQYPRSDGALLIKSSWRKVDEKIDSPVCSIVLDPGHGGEDFGAQGVTTGVLEKDVVLEIAKKISLLLREKRIDVSLTRSSDIFVPLEKRSLIAQEVSPDAFLSIHLNYEPSRKASGLEIYVLNTESTAAALKLASRENEGATPPDEASIILSKASQEEFSESSRVFAQNLREEISLQRKSSGFDSVDLGVKEALFYVLVGVRAPSALLELGFLSSEEERMFLDDAYIASTAQGISQGIERFCRNNTPRK